GGQGGVGKRRCQSRVRERGNGADKEADRSGALEQGEQADDSRAVQRLFGLRHYPQANRAGEKNRGDSWRETQDARDSEIASSIFKFQHLLPSEMSSRVLVVS